MPWVSTATLGQGLYFEKKKNTENSKHPTLMDLLQLQEQMSSSDTFSQRLNRPSGEQSSMGTCPGLSILGIRLGVLIFAPYRILYGAALSISLCCRTVVVISQSSQKAFCLRMCALFLLLKLPVWTLLFLLAKIIGSGDVFRCKD